MLLLSWTELQIVALYITSLRPRGLAFAFCLHCGYSRNVNTVGTQHWLCYYQSWICFVLPVSVQISLSWAEELSWLVHYTLWQCYRCRYTYSRGIKPILVNNKSEFSLCFSAKKCIRTILIFNLLNVLLNISPVSVHCCHLLFRQVLLKDCVLVETLGMAVASIKKNDFHGPNWNLRWASYCPRVVCLTPMVYPI